MSVARTFKCVLCAAALLLLTAGSARAQDRIWHINFGGGPTLIFDRLGDGFNMGWGPAVGVSFNLGPQVEFQFEYAYRYFYLDDDLDFNFGRYDANHQTHQLAFNLTGNLTPPDSPVRLYATGGPGMYYRKVEITEYVGTGVICDPWLYLCGSYPISDVIGSRGGWDFGFNVGGGVAFNLGDEAEFYIETRYHYVWGPETAPPTATPVAGSTFEPVKVNGQYLPITFGLRF